MTKGLRLKLSGQGLGCFGVAATILLLITDAPPVFLVVITCLICVGIVLDVLGRTLCLAAPSEDLGRRAIIRSVVAQTLAVCFAAVAFPWPFWPNAIEVQAVRIVFALAALLSHYLSATYFSEFLLQLANHFERPDLADLARSLQSALRRFLVAIEVALPMIVAAFVIVALGVTIITFGVGWILGLFFGVVAAGIVAIPCMTTIVIVFVPMQMRYSSLVFRLSKLALQAANLHSNSIES